MFKIRQRCVEREAKMSFFDAVGLKGMVLCKWHEDNVAEWSKALH